MVLGKSARVEGGVEDAVGGEKKDIAVVVGGEAGTCSPDRTFAAVGREVDDGFLLERGGAVCHDPAGVGTGIAVRGPAEIDVAVG